MSEKSIMIGGGILGIAAIAINGFNNPALWALLLFPFFFIGKPWYKFFASNSN